MINQLEGRAKKIFEFLDKKDFDKAADMIDFFKQANSFLWESNINPITPTVVDQQLFTKELKSHALEKDEQSFKEVLSRLNSLYQAMGTERLTDFISSIKIKKSLATPASNPDWLGLLQAMEKQAKTSPDVQELKQPLISQVSAEAIATVNDIADSLESTRKKIETTEKLKQGLQRYQENPKANQALEEIEKKEAEIINDFLDPLEEELERTKDNETLALEEKKQALEEILDKARRYIHINDQAKKFYADAEKARNQFQTEILLNKIKQTG